MVEVVERAASSVSKSYEISLDLKAEVENKYRSVRKIRNPNPCQPVSFHFFQLMKKYRRELFLVEQTYDCMTPAGMVEEKELGVITFLDRPRRTEHLDPSIVPQPPAWMLPDSVKGPLSCHDSAALGSQQYQPVMSVHFDRSGIKEFSKERVLSDLRQRVDREEAETTAKFIDELDSLADPSGGGLISVTEYCIGTDGFHVEALTSECAACDDSALKLKELDVRKAELELEKLKCEISLCEKELSSRGKGGKEDKGYDSLPR